MTLKRRQLLDYQAVGRSSVLVNMVETSSNLHEALLIGRQLTDSTSHHFHRRRKNDKHLPVGLRGLDRGGPFKTQTVRHEPSPYWANWQTPSPALAWKYVGPLFAHSGNLQYAESVLLASSTPSQMLGYGATGIARAIPTNPLAGLGQTLGEMRETPRLLNLELLKKTAFKARNKAFASDYLNMQFGWLPLVRDVQKFLKVASKEHEHITQLERNSGQDVRRGSTVFEDTVTVVDILGTSYGWPSLATQMFQAPGIKSRTTVTKTKVYFRGAFTYYLPPTGTKSMLGWLKRKEAIAAALYGLRLTPDLFYNLTPWSWALDWVTNTGDVVHNWSAFANDKLTMRYGYVMETKTQTVTYSLNDLILSNGTRLNLTQTVIKETKSRVRATPFGFGLNPSSFTPKQWAIIAALGISRAPRSLNF